MTGGSRICKISHSFLCIFPSASFLFPSTKLSLFKNSAQFFDEEPRHLDEIISDKDEDIDSGSQFASHPVDNGFTLYRDTNSQRREQSYCF
ncbi:hypothetical protein chiPu_0015994 [Chiloscyllium punctatum]|uniref:Uncharacterized protein n=1 Tax=Chiloscyllium punctatum TaxID=137246 RepID=A0A401T4F7_CHIPU|nr:hypothetical protein [Chiloscyllium punctatum]